MSGEQSLQREKSLSWQHARLMHVRLEALEVELRLDALEQQVKALETAAEKRQISSIEQAHLSQKIERLAQLRTTRLSLHQEQVRLTQSIRSLTLKHLFQKARSFVDV